MRKSLGMMLMVLFLGAVGAQAEFITNGGFESGEAGPTGWTVSDNGGSGWRFCTAEYVSPGRSMRSDVAWASISQTVSDLPTSDLTLSFYGKNPDGSWPEIYVTVKNAATSEILNAWYPYPNAPPSWWYYSADFSLPAGVDDITISFAMKSGSQLIIDNVSLVPEPATMTVLLAGGIGAMLRRRK
jgi:hypothetical protein